MKLFYKIFSKDERNVVNYVSGDLYLLIRNVLMKNKEIIHTLLEK